MTIDVEVLKDIRNETGLPVSTIRKALEQAEGDRAKALEILSSTGAKMAEKKAERETHEGVVAQYVHSNKKIGVLVKLLCETDFVARNPEFQVIANEIAMHVAAMKPMSVEECLSQPTIHDSSVTVEQRIQAGIAKLGENIKLEEIVRVQI